MEITCLTDLQETEDKKLFDVYDIAELEFELSEPLTEEAFFCAELCEEARYLFRDDLKITDGKFKIETGNFLDILKCLPDACLEWESFPLSFQVETNSSGRGKSVVEVKNPWYKS